LAATLPPRDVAWLDHCLGVADWKFRTLWLIDPRSREVAAVLDLRPSDAMSDRPPPPASGLDWARVLIDSDPAAAVLGPTNRPVTLAGAAADLKLDWLGATGSPADVAETWDPWRRLMATQGGELAVYDLQEGWLHYRNRRLMLGTGLIRTGDLEDWPDAILDPSRSAVYVPFADGTESGLRVFDFASEMWREIPLEADALGSRGVVSHDRRRIYLFFEDLWAIDLVNGKVLRRQRLEPPMYAVGAALSPDDRVLYLLEGRGQFLRAIGTDTFETLWQSPLAEDFITTTDHEASVSPLDRCYPALPD
jgi:hypothetical protein